MRTDCTETDLGTLRAWGFPFLAADATAPRTTEALALAVLRMTHNPSARLVEAVAWGCVQLARCQHQALPLEGADITQLRRLGYVLARLVEHGALDPTTQAHLLHWLQQPHLKNISEQDAKKPISLSTLCNSGRLQRLQQSADEINRRWGVYGDVHLRDLPPIARTTA